MEVPKDDVLRSTELVVSILEASSFEASIGF